MRSNAPSAGRARVARAGVVASAWVGAETQASLRAHRAKAEHRGGWLHLRRLYWDGWQNGGCD